MSTFKTCYECARYSYCMDYNFGKEIHPCFKQIKEKDIEKQIKNDIKNDSR